MTGFSGDWLALREPFDRAVRAAAWAGVDLAALASGWRGRADRLHVVDLGCGIGANLRELAPRLQGAQHWTLVDHDAALLAALPAAMASWAQGAGCRLHRQGDALRIEGVGWQAELTLQACDLASGLARVPLAQAHLVTASALLDLVSASWFDALLDACARVPALLFALSADPRIDWTPPDEDDAMVRQLFAAHQSGDKGFGPALGPLAPPWAAQRLQARGWAVQSQCSDWTIAPGDAHACAADAAMLHALVAGIAGAAAVQDGSAAMRVAAWRERRLAAAARTRLTVGHIDLLATRAR